jgi:hypothetical protein
MRLVEPTVLPSPAAEVYPSWEQDLGHRVAELASILAGGLIERERDGRISQTTKHDGGELLASLASLKMRIGSRFDEVARKYGIQSLCEHIAGPPNPAVPDVELVEKLIGETLKLVSGVLKKCLN